MKKAPTAYDLRYAGDHSSTPVSRTISAVGLIVLVAVWLICLVPCLLWFAASWLAGKFQPAVKPKANEGVAP